MPDKDIETRIAKLEGGAIVFQGAIEILMSFLYTRSDKEDFLSFFKSVSESGKFSKEATLVAKKYLDLDSVFGEHNFQPGQSEQ